MSGNAAFGLVLGCLLLIRVEGLMRLRFREFGRFMMRGCSSWRCSTSFGWLVGPSRLVAWLAGVMLLGFLLSGWVGLVFVRSGAM